MFQTRPKTILTLLVLTLALAVSLLLGPTRSARAASGPDFTLSANPTSLTLIRGSGTDSVKDVTVQVGSVNGFSGNVTLVSNDTYAKTFTAWFDTSGNLLQIDNNPVTIAAPGTLILQVTANRDGPNCFGNPHPIPITATSGNLQHTVQIEMTVIRLGGCG